MWDHTVHTFLAHNRTAMSAAIAIADAAGFLHAAVVADVRLDRRAALATKASSELTSSGLDVREEVLQRRGATVLQLELWGQPWGGGGAPRVHARVE